MSDKGTISINTENIFPIIKKFLYSDHEIFLRELVSNGVDACQKLKKLTSFGQFDGEVGELKVTVSIDEAAKTSYIKVFTLRERVLYHGEKRFKRLLNIALVYTCFLRNLCDYVCLSHFDSLL